MGWPNSSVCVDRAIIMACIAAWVILVPVVSTFRWLVLNRGRPSWMGLSLIRMR